MIGIVSLGHEYRSQRMTVLFRIEAENFQAPCTNCSSCCFTVTLVPGKHIIETFFLKQHFK